MRKPRGSYEPAKTLERAKRRALFAARMGWLFIPWRQLLVLSDVSQRVTRMNWVSSLWLN